MVGSACAPGIAKSMNSDGIAPQKYFILISYFLDPDRVNNLLKAHS
jgi:hypothetical protein